jgi:hypothetical protein
MRGRIVRSYSARHSAAADSVYEVFTRNRNRNGKGRCLRVEKGGGEKTAQE